MPDQNQTPPQTVIVERSGGGGFGLGLVAVVLFVAVLVGGYFLMTMKNNDTRKTDAIERAADKIGDGAKKVGDSAEKAADQATK